MRVIITSVLGDTHFPKTFFIRTCSNAIVRAASISEAGSLRRRPIDDDRVLAGAASVGSAGPGSKPGDGFAGDLED